MLSTHLPLTVAADSTTYDPNWHVPSDSGPPDDSGPLRGKLIQMLTSGDPLCGYDEGSSVEIMGSLQIPHRWSVASAINEECRDSTGNGSRTDRCLTAQLEQKTISDDVSLAATR
jgi:hypothetical protein